MLKINLIKSKSGAKQAGQTLSHGGLAALSVLVAVILGGGGFYLYNFLYGKNKPVVLKPDTSDYKASTHSVTKAVEDIVKEVAADRSGSPGILDIAYNDMAFNERITYEVLHTKKVLELLSRTFPEGIGLRKLEISKFQTIYAVGLGDTKEIISQTFNALRRERAELLPRPYSFITSDVKGYRFIVTLKTGFGLDFSDSFQAADHLVSREYLTDQIKKVTSVAEMDNIVLLAAPRQQDVEIVGGYRRYIYKFKAECTYRDFVRFVMDLSKDQVPCAFKEIRIDALAGSTIGVDAEMVITVKN